jgi:hypothetical protein
MSKGLVQVSVVVPCIAGMVYLASHGNSGWGWLVAIAIIAIL